MSFKAINALRSSVAKLHPLVPLYGLELAVQRGTLTVVKEKTALGIGIACNFPSGCTPRDLLDAINHGADHLVQALACVDRIAVARRRPETTAAFDEGFNAVEAFMNAVVAAHRKSLPLEAAE